jgi:hypothetical protein
MKAYDSALALIQQIEDDDFRGAAIEAVIVQRVRRETGSNDPAGALAMTLRRSAFQFVRRRAGAAVNPRLPHH